MLVAVAMGGGQKLVQADEERAEALLKLAQKDVRSRWELYRQMAAMHYDGDGANGNGSNGKSGD